ncbi:hypothetical protein HK102_009965 [Quaeritorhiza haematococci]|nr:hypothetical protein HK102_009965 [Quaeritorhiza haematococci]
MRSILRIIIAVFVTIFLLSAKYIRAAPPPQDTSQQAEAESRPADVVLGPQSTTPEDISNWMYERVRLTGDPNHGFVRLYALDTSKPNTLRGDVAIVWPFSDSPDVLIRYFPADPKGDWWYTARYMQAKYAQRLDDKHVLMHFEAMGFEEGVSKIEILSWYPGRGKVMDTNLGNGYWVNIETTKKTGQKSVGAAFRKLGRVVGIGRGQTKKKQQNTDSGDTN